MKPELHSRPASLCLDDLPIERNLPAGAVGRRDASAALLTATALAFAGWPDAARAQAVQLFVVDVAAVGQGYQVSKLLRKNVQNDKDEKIGTLDDLIITNDQKLFSILQVGGFLGLGGRLIAVPYQALQLSDDGRKIVLPGASKEALEKLPEFHYRA
jgi:sporulation protein YlmC with PRC-barrel domain